MKTEKLSTNTPETLRKLQLVEMKALDEVKRICEMHDLKYFLIAGNLIGAIRHKGFIPWDDDIDIGMMRSDYDKFIEYCKTKPVVDAYFAFDREAFIRALHDNGFISSHMLHLIRFHDWAKV